jgi:hypothetical protein
MRLSTITLITLLALSCSDDETPTPAPTLDREWTIPLSAKFENPAPANRAETGTATLQLMSDKSLKYTLTVTGLAASDALTAAHLHVGNVITNGNVIQDLNPTFTNGVATGTITNLRSSLVDSLKSDINDIYINIHSTQVGSGLVRGQLNTQVEFAQDVVLNSANEVPAGTSAATGLAVIRLASDRQLYTLITVTGVETGDALTAAHYHRAATGVNGPILLDIYSSAAQFGTVKVSAVDDPFIAALKNDPTYVNVHSTSKPGGLIRGQIR